MKVSLNKKQARKFYKDRETTKGCSQWYASSCKRQAKLRASHIDLEAKYDTGDFQGV